MTTDGTRWPAGSWIYTNLAAKQTELCKECIVTNSGVRKPGNGNVKKFI